MFTRPIGPINPTQVQALLAKRERRARVPEEIAALAELVPRDLLERLARTAAAERDAAVVAEDPVIVKGTPDQCRADFEREKASPIWPDLPLELRDQMEGLASWTIDAAGKRLSELKLTMDADEIAKAREEEIQAALANVPRLLVTDWVNVPYLLRKGASTSATETHRLNERLFPVDPPAVDAYLSMQGFHDWDGPMAHALATWLEAEHVRQLYDAFAANFRAKLDAAPGAPFGFAGELLFGKDADGYYVTLL